MARGCQLAGLGHLDLRDIALPNRSIGLDSDGTRSSLGARLGRAGLGIDLEL